MVNRRGSFILCAGCLILLSGCVERRFVIESTPPGAKVYVNNKPVGFTPVDVPFIYYGKYKIELELDGYQTHRVIQKVTAPVYAYPPFDLVVENLYPGKISDIQRFHYELVPLSRPNLDELRLQAEELRRRGQELPPPTIPVQPNGNRPNATAPPPPRRETPPPPESLPPPIDPTPP